jgi:hypothetical protein
MEGALRRIRFAESAPLEIGRAIVVAAIWIPYFLISKRVKNTFIR